MAGWDTVIKGGRVIDPPTQTDAVLDVAISGGKVAALAPQIEASNATEVIEAGGKLVIPGLVDPHVHLTGWLGGEPGHVMMARAGVSTAIDVAGPISELLVSLSRHGAGLNIGCLHMASPNRLGLSADPTNEEFASYYRQALADGAIGIKILGGHFPFTPETTARALRVATELGIFIMVHAGSTEKQGGLSGIEELFGFAGDSRYHVAHVNSYCRGRGQEALEMADKVLGWLEERPHLSSDSYLDPHNGVPGTCDASGELDSQATRYWIGAGGFPTTREGVLAALRAGWAYAILRRGRENFYVTGEEAARGWVEAGDPPPALAFLANDACAQRAVATRKNADGKFIVPTLGTDGGGMPRNTALHYGLGLVEDGLLTMSELVHKASTAPARLYGIAGKGSIGDGADADIAIVDLKARRAEWLLVGGVSVFAEGEVTGSGGALLVRPEAEWERLPRTLAYRQVEGKQIQDL